MQLEFPLNLISLKMNSLHKAYQNTHNLLVEFIGIQHS